MSTTRVYLKSGKCLNIGGSWHLDKEAGLLEVIRWIDGASKVVMFIPYENIEYLAEGE